MVVTLIVYAAVWPVLINTIYGLDEVDPGQGHPEGLRLREAVILMVSLPSAAPFIDTGVRLASSIAIILDAGVGIVTGPVDGPGIGAFIANANSNGGIPRSAQHDRRARSIDQVQMDNARAYRLPSHQRVTRLILPAAAPKIFAGIRLSPSLALVLMVVAELVGTANSIGYEMNNAANTFDLPGLWSGIVLLGILGLALNAALLAAEHRVLAWHRDAQRVTP